MPHESDEEPCDDVGGLVAGSGIDGAPDKGLTYEERGRQTVLRRGAMQPQKKIRQFRDRKQNNR